MDKKNHLDTIIETIENAPDEECKALETFFIELAETVLMEYIRGKNEFPEYSAKQRMVEFLKGMRDGFF